MPFIVSRTNVAVTADQEAALKSGLGKAIECVPGKTENSLMLVFEDRCRLYLRGDDERPMAYVTVAVFGNPEHRGYAELSAAVVGLYSEVLGVPEDDTYIRYEDIASWSVGSRFFDTIRQDA